MEAWSKVKTLFVQHDRLPAPKKYWGRERRMTVRKPQRLAQAFICSDSMAFPKECRIRNLSVMGARIDLSDGAVKAHMLIDNLTIYFPSEKKEIGCLVVWLAGRSMGLRFVGPYCNPIGDTADNPVSGQMNRPGDVWSHYSMISAKRTAWAIKTRHRI